MVGPMRSNQLFHCGSREGFSLVELLVVIAIATLLLALLLPTLQNAWRQARTLAALANLSQIGRSVHAYAIENGDAFPVGWRQGGVKRGYKLDDRP